METDLEVKREKPILIRPSQNQLLLAEIFDDLEEEENEVIVSGK